MTAPVTRIDAIRYARHERNAAANFTTPVDDHDLPMPLDYFVWAIHRDGASAGDRRYRVSARPRPRRADGR